MVLPSMLWIMLWGGYNTGIETLLDPDFPTNALNLFHGLRALLPILAGYIAVVSLLKNRASPEWLIQGPIGLLMLYALIGVIPTVFLSTETLIPIYWLAVYGSVLIVLMAISASSDPLKRFSYLLSINWVIIAAIMVNLLLALLFLKDLALAETEGSPLNVRAYVGELASSGQMWGMAATRNTGFGRYASIAGLVAMTRLWKGRWWVKGLWLLTLGLSLYSLILSQARTAVLGFVIASLILLWLRKSSRPVLFAGTIFALLLLGFVGFYQGFWHFIIRGGDFDPTLSGRTELWKDGLEMIKKSPLLGFGFHADRIFMDGQHMHNAFLHALIQTGIIGTLPFIAAFSGIWVLLFRFHKAQNPGGGHPLEAEIIAVIVFFTIASITESTIAFYGAAWLIVAPLIAYLQAWNHTAQTASLSFKSAQSRFHQQLTYDYNSIKRY